MGKYTQKHILNTSIIAFLLVFFVSETISQTIRINEVVAVNTFLNDEDANTSDWLELYNYGTTAVSLNNFALSDDETNLSKWLFSNIAVQPNEYLMVFASGNERYYNEFPRTIIKQGDLLKYIIPSEEPSSQWKNISFNDASWNEGPSGIGYGDEDDETEVAEGTKSIFTRTVFEIEHVEYIKELFLDIDYDDGFVAYINGTEVARDNIEGNPPGFYDPATEDSEANMYIGGAPRKFEISNPQNYLIDGENVLAIQIHNTGTSSSDLSLIPFLTCVFDIPTSIGDIPMDILGIHQGLLHTNFKISSKGETIFLSNAQGEVIDQMIVEDVLPDVSLGISSNNSDVVYFLETTPGAPNSENEYIDFITEEPIFSHQGGEISGPLSLSISGQINGQVIRYTTDATLPNENSQLYSTPINISNTSVIRAAIFRNQYIPSKPQSRSFIDGVSHEIDVMLLTTEPDNFFDDEIGIYTYGEEGTYEPTVPYFGANFWEDWERPIHFALYESDDKQLQIEYNAGVKIYGGWSRGQNEQRSLAFYARKEYGKSSFNFPFFEELSYDKFENVILRNSGQDWVRSSIKDVALTSLMEGTGLDYLAFRPVATYINGEYWGLYHLREKINEHFIANKHDVDTDDITILTANSQQVYGSNDEYEELIDYVESSDMANDHNYSYVEAKVDIENYIIYNVCEIYFNNSDWPSHNVKYWKTTEGKWQWILYDLDFGFGPRWETDDYYVNSLSAALEENGPEWPNPPWSTFLFRSLSENQVFRNQFINRYADELNTRFLPHQVKLHFDRISASIEPEIEAHHIRWDAEDHDQSYYVSEMKNWADNRPAFAKEHLMAQFQLPAIHSLSLLNDQIEEGLIIVNNNLRIQEESWNGEYFETVPVLLKAVPELGYAFSHWSGAISSTEQEITIELVDFVEVKAHFTPNNDEMPLVINEINYNSSDEFDPDDWIEIYNPNNNSIDISNWIFKDENDDNSFIIPEGIELGGNSYLVFAKDLISFGELFPDVNNVIGEFPFGLSSNTDAIRLFNQDLILQDQVIYMDSLPWPMCADGIGPTLELITSHMDNAIPESWDCKNPNGSPGKENLNYAVNEIINSKYQFFPNPVNDKIYILGVKSMADINIYNISGQLVLKTSAKTKVDVIDLSKGVYILDIKENGITSRHKIIKN